jgi:CRP-like cAMP-binding protein
MTQPPQATVLQFLSTALRKFPMLADLPATALGKLAEVARIRDVKRGIELFHQGDLAEVFALIQSGRLNLVQRSAEGKEVTLAALLPGDEAGLVVAWLGLPYPGSVVVAEDSTVIMLPGAVLWDVFRDYPEFSLAALRAVAFRLFDAQNRIRELTTERAQQRLARSLLRLAKRVSDFQQYSQLYSQQHSAGQASHASPRPGVARVDLRLSQQDLAQMCGTTFETVSRILATWERDDILVAKRELITIHNPHALERIAEDEVAPLPSAASSSGD